MPTPGRRRFWLRIVTSLRKITGELLEKESLDGQEFYRLVGKEMPRAKEPAPPLPEAAAAKA